MATDASNLYARNILEFINLLINEDGRLHIDLEDEIVAACLVAHAGKQKGD